MTSSLRVLSALRFSSFLMLILCAPLGASAASSAAKSGNMNQWDLSQIYPSEQAWRKAMEQFKARLPELKPCQGHLGDSAEMLKRCLDLKFELQIPAERIYVWAQLRKSADRLNRSNIECADQADDLWSKLAQELAFLRPELIQLGREKVENLQKKSKELDIYQQYLRTIMDQADHTLDEKREKLLASLSPVLWANVDVQKVLLTSDIPWKTEKFSDGKSREVDEIVYQKFRDSPNRADRVRAFSAFYAVLGQYERTFGATLSNSVRRDVIMAREHNYPSALAEALDGEKIPEEVYRTLVREVNSGLPAFQSYLTLKKQQLGLKQLEYVDAYAPGTEVKAKFPLEKTQQIVLAALAPLGAEYVQGLKTAFSGGWMDAYPRKGKDTGAFMEPGAAFEVHPYVLLNHLDDYESALTFAHEWGHAMHTVLSTAAQPYPYIGYATFIAEIASQTNEILLNEYQIRNAKNPAEKAFYLEALLKLIRGSFYRQTQFAEFELQLHEEIEKGAALSGQRMSEIYGEIARRYYGHDQGVMRVDKKYFTEWEFIPHFYNAFYVYQYATSISAAFYFAEHILANKPGAVENYLKVLRSGSSKYPYEILLDAGVDMKSPAVYQAVVERMKSAVEELKAIGK